MDDAGGILFNNSVDQRNCGQNGLASQEPNALLVSQSRFQMHFSPLACNGSTGHSEFGVEKTCLVKLWKNKSEFIEGVEPEGVIHLFIIY